MESLQVALPVFLESCGLWATPGRSCQTAGRRAYLAILPAGAA
jgi:hypothetical protein